MKSDWKQFQKVCNNCVCTLRRERKQHVSNLKNDLSNLSPSCKTWWCLVKSVTGVYSPSLSSNRTTANSTREKAECLNSVFAPKSFTPTPHSLYSPFPIIPTAPVVCRLLLRRWESFWQFSTLTVTGPDGISSHILKTCSAALALPLSALFTPVNYHRSSSICLEISQHHSITLEGTKTDPLNCRPISLLPIIIKVMESIIAVDLKSFLFSNSLISYHQFRFKLAHSPLGMLLDILDTWYTNNGWRPSISGMRSEPSFWTYLKLSIQSVLLPCSPNCLLWNPRPSPLLDYWLLPLS